MEIAAIAGVTVAAAFLAVVLRQQNRNLRWRWD